MTALEVLVLAGATGVFVLAVRSVRRRAVTARLEEAVSGGDLEDLLDDIETRALGRPRWLILVAAAVAGGGLVSLGSGLPVAVGGAALAAALAAQLESLLHVRRQVRYESQLAETLDLVVGGLRAGVGVVDALAAGAARVADPLRTLLLDLVERLRIGDDPVEAMTSLGRRVPLETYRLTGLTLGASWEGGGGYADALSGVGRTTRERLALRRRLNSQSLEARVSVVVILLVTWGLLGMAFLRDPVVARDFVTSGMGEGVLTVVLALQALGLFWIDSLVSAEA